MTTKRIIWLAWILLTLGLGSFYGYTLLYSEDKSELLIGEATHGHFQIEMACSSCHTDPFGGKEVLQNACTNCHQEDLDNAHDSHPKKKFTDPRDAHLLKTIDARYCISCHTEHQHEQTRDMGVTLPDDFCWHCHKDVADTRDSHKDLAFNSCASAGCHNFHDNRALFENFLVQNANQPWLSAIAEIPFSNHAETFAKEKVKAVHTSIAQQNIINQHPDIHGDWASTSHGQAGVDCVGCHGASKESEIEWIEKPGLQQCQSCHSAEAKGFTEGKHGMRLAGYIGSNLLDTGKPRLTPMSPAQSQSDLTFNTSNEHAQQECSSCHKAHEFERSFAKVEACLSCHTDEHSLNYQNSKHAELWQAGIDDPSVVPQEVTCATCHLPKITEKKHGKEITRVEHNQNINLRPNEKMIRPVCMNCHSLEFSIDALADPDLIKSNFSSKPDKHIESIDWALKRAE